MPVTDKDPAVSLALAEPASVPFTTEAETILKLAREGRRLVRGPQGRERHPVRRLMALLEGVREFGTNARERSEAETVGDIAVSLDAHIDRFITLAAAVGSPAKYQLALRRSRNELSALLADDAGKQQVGAASYKTLTQIIDMVELTRRDVDRRWIDVHPAWAARLVSGEFPVDTDPEAFALVLGTTRDRIDAWAVGSERPTASEFARLRLVAQLTYDLRYSHTPHGLLEWFSQSFDELGHRSPLEIMSTPTTDGVQALRDYARNLRVQVAT